MTKIKFPFFYGSYKKMKIPNYLSIKREVFGVEIDEVSVRLRPLEVSLHCHPLDIHKKWKHEGYLTKEQFKELRALIKYINKEYPKCLKNLRKEPV